MTMFQRFNDRELEDLSNWKYHVEDKSITTEFFTPYWDRWVKLLPTDIAPNVITLIGLICTIYSWYLCHYYLESHQFLTSLFSAFLFFAYFTFDALDGKQARRTRNGSPMGELLDHAFDNVSLVFIVVPVTMALGITNPIIQWLVVQGGTLLFTVNHLEALSKGVVEFGRYDGPGEFLMVGIAIITLGSVTNFSWIHYICDFIFGPTTKVVLFVLCYLGILVYTLDKIVGLNNKYDGTKIVLLRSIFIRVLFSLCYMLFFTIDIYAVISQGLIMTILTSDLIVAKMSKSQLHPLIPVIMAVSLISNTLCVVLCVAYHVAIFYQISYGLNLPMFTVKKNVLVYGVWDLTHEGHVKAFKNAAALGNRLFVGVHNDQDVKSYKRQPIRTHQERCDMVKLLKHVDQVIPNCPLNPSEEFLKEYDIHVVACDPEYYDDVNSKFYKVERQLGILQKLPRTPGVSTSELIKRVKEHTQKDIVDYLISSDELDKKTV